MILFRILKILFYGKKTWPFIIGVVMGLSFSMAIVLTTLGLMDGFERSIKESLHNFSGDFIAYSNNGLFKKNTELINYLETLPIKDMSFYIKTEAFLIKENASVALQVQGINPVSFSKISQTTFKIGKNEIAIGEKLATQQNLKIGDSLVLALAQGNQTATELPKLKRYKISQIINHGIYQKDLRMVYILAKTLQKDLGWQDLYNSIVINIKKNLLLEDFENQAKFSMRTRGLILRPYFYEYGPLLSAVKMEKITIGLILQIIVIVSIFNLIAIIIYLKEKKSQELFLFLALGLSPRYALLIWPLFSFLLTPFCYLGSYLFIQIFKLGLEKLSFLQMPGEIYHVARLKLHIDISSYIYVFLGTAIIMQILTMMISLSFKNKSLISNLRKEFS